MRTYKNWPHTYVKAAFARQHIEHGFQVLGQENHEATDQRRPGTFRQHETPECPIFQHFLKRKILMNKHQELTRSTYHDRSTLLLLFSFSHHPRTRWRAMPSHSLLRRQSRVVEPRLDSALQRLRKSVHPRGCDQGDAGVNEHGQPPGAVPFPILMIIDR